MDEFNAFLEDTVALSLYDTIQMRKIPTMEAVAENAIAGASYEYVGKQVLAMVGQRIFPNQMKEATLAGKFIGIPVGLAIADTVMGDKINWQKHFMKSLVSIGALSVWKAL